jgi:hypothetical protein
MRKLLFLILLGSGLWSGYWFVGSGAIRQGIEDGFADAAAQGLVAEKSALTVAGFPNRFDVTIEGLRLMDPATGAGLEAPFLQVFAMTWKPWHVIAALAPDQTVTLPDQTVSVTSDGLRASFRSRPSTDLPLAAIVLEANGLAATSSAGWTLGTGRSVVSLSADEEVAGAGDAPNTYLFSTDLTDATPDPGFLIAVKAVTIEGLPASDLPETIDSLRAGVFLTFTAPLDRNAGQAKPLVSKVDVSTFAFTWGQLSATAKGQIQADDQGFAAGEITVEVTNWNRLPALLVAAGVVKPEVAPTIARGMQALAAQSDDLNVLSLKLTLADGRMSFGPFPLGPAPLMLPPSG